MQMSVIGVLLMCLFFVFVFFFFKQKTAYERRISDWSSDVCSSDLAGIESLEVDPAVAAIFVVQDSRDKESAQDEEQVNSQKSAAYRSIWRAVEQDDGDYRDGTEPVEFRNMASRGRTHLRSEERRVGKECVSTGRSRLSRYQ